MRINEAAELAGVTVRTLHHYDKIGLLSPVKSAENGYRDYGEAELLRLQQIMFLKEMDFPLEEIKEMLDEPGLDRNRMMEAQLDLLLKKKQRLERIIALLEAEMRGENKMSFKEFDMKEIEACRKKYADEAREKWGGTEAYKESEERTKNYDEGKWQKVNDEQGIILSEFAAFAAEGVKPDSSEAWLWRLNGRIISAIISMSAQTRFWSDWRKCISLMNASKKISIKPGRVRQSSCQRP